MPKLKTKKGVAKRIKVTKKGKLKYYKAGKGHILTKKRTKRKRFLRKPGLISDSDKKAFRALLPYGTT